MYYHKYPLPSNFEFVQSISTEGSFETAKGAYRAELFTSEQDVYRIRVSGQGWEASDSQTELQMPRSLPGENASTSMTLGADGSFEWSLTGDDQVLLRSQPGRFFGQCGLASIFEFIHCDDDKLYGMGEKWNGFEHRGKTQKFWNTDVWADFNPASYVHGKPAPDPTYLSVPYVIIKRGDTFIGLLMDNPHATFISSTSKRSIAGQMEVDGDQGGKLYLGAEQGQPDLYLIFGPSLAELTRKLQRLVGVTPLPPVWALGYQQCRWGYTSEKDLLELDANFSKYEIPVDGLWLDIDYMDGYRVFTFAAEHFQDLEGTLMKLDSKGRKVVPILDPGVKSDPNYKVYQSGVAADAFCQNPQGGLYTGLVWPGETVFPDYSTVEGREWWSAQVAEFASVGIYGAWLDMNDPATGPADNEQMLFNHGSASHSTYHNQYALGMSMATREGFLRTHPDQRPFLLSRSGCTGIGRYAAIWTGDNYSNYYHLKNSIAISINLALSGVPFNGADVGGFGGDTTPELILDWFKAGFLFPVFRNHAGFGSRQQEPWAFDAEVRDLLRHYVRLRYRLRPYLYQLFIEQERSGEAILRPLFYDFNSTEAHPLEHIDDAFMVGPSILQAPFLEANQASRKVVLPGIESWYAPDSGEWLLGPTEFEVQSHSARTPIFIRDGSILPMARLQGGEHAFDARQIDFQLYLTDGKVASTRYVMDDGSSYQYLAGKRSEMVLQASRQADQIEIEIEVLKDGFGQGEFTFTTEFEIQSVCVNGREAVLGAQQGVALGVAATKTWFLN